MTLSPEMATSNSSLQVPSISVIIPTFNQQSKISYSLTRIKQQVELYYSNYELIVVDDGSTDNTLTILKNIALMDPHLQVISYKPNRGKGYAIKQGVLHSHGEAVMFMDADLDISPDFIKDYVEKLSLSDLIIGSKRHPKSNVTIPKSRAFLSRAFNIFIRAATGIPQKDTQVGFKVGNGEIMRTVFRGISVHRYAFDVELFTISSILHLRVQEMPVIMKIDRRFNTREIVNMLVDVLRICYRQRVLHAYDKEVAVHLSSKPDHDRGSFNREVLQHGEAQVLKENGL
jgi:glycosyltransferase involved in cell wall biosynthesis